jgi:acyl transferase domain-containing protein/tryptophanase/acyl carrier protein/SAM-dependent methyltransferase
MSQVEPGLQERAEAHLRQLISRVGADLPPAFDANTAFRELGIDSFHVLKIIKQLEADFGKLPKTLLFEHFNLSHLAGYFASRHAAQLRAGVGADAAPAPPQSASAAVPAGAALVLERDARADSVQGPLLDRIYAQYKTEGSVSRGTRIIAPYLFLGSRRRGYFHCGRSKQILLAYAYTGPQDEYADLAREMHEYTRRNGWSLNLFSGSPLESVGGVAYSATPFGAIQRITDLQQFSLEGGAMRRLRYQVSRFEKAGTCRLEEYQRDARPEVSREIVTIIDDWCAGKAMVNPLVGIVRAEIAAGSLDSQHRLFLTYVDGVMQNAILISALSGVLKGYLMDLEFYRREMPLGGLEFAIVRIIATLAAEGCELLSLGGTYGCRLEGCANADPQVDQLLDELQQQGIFNDQGNLQFKNKFRPRNSSIYLCREAGKPADEVLDIIMMIADPAAAQESAIGVPQAAQGDPGTLTGMPAAVMSDGGELGVQPAVIGGAQVPGGGVGELGHAGTEGLSVSAPRELILGQKRSLHLARAGFNTLNLAREHVEIDLKSDSWARLHMPSIATRMSQLHTQLQHTTDVDSSLRQIFPFTHFVLTPSGRAAERVFYRSWEKKGRILQNLLFPTGIYHQIDNGFAPLELPCAEAFRLDSRDPYKGNLSWGKLVEKIGEGPNEIALVCMELGNNAVGGGPVSISQLRDVKALLAKHSIALVLDATRVLQNAQCLIQQENEHADESLWVVVQQMLACADVVLCSLAKEFCINKGGLIATNDTTLYRRLKEVAHEEGATLDPIDKRLIGLAARNRRDIESQIQRRAGYARKIGAALASHGLPVVEPVGSHCILLDIKQVPELHGLEEPVATFLAWLYLHTGIRASAHNAGMQKGTALNDLVRIAIPVGMKRQWVDEIIERLAGLFRHKHTIPELAANGAAPIDASGEIRALYRLKQYGRLEGELICEWPSEDVLTDPMSAGQAAGLTSAPPAAAHALGAAETSAVASAPSGATAHSGDIAIIGMAGRYPKARNLDELWANLLQGLDCIEDLPAERRRQRPATHPELTYRGGFLSDVDKFDSLFFNISPREAAMLDPQERLFLEVAWEAVEDAGYYPEALADEAGRRDVGVFVGAVWTLYQMLHTEERRAQANTVPNSFLWSVANRVSYWMNLCGPSLTLDTACSSSLTALYLACEAIRSGECSAAIVGGVNLDLHQSKFEINSGGGALSPDGVCRSFGRGANGYVAAEGVGALFIKSLDRAIRDGDHVYGVIKSIVANHGGRTSGYTVPNPTAQTELIRSALSKAAVDARTIGYIEAHGTGTELGDPIEVAGLSHAFEPDAVTRGACAIGSIKSNIGHLEAAAGVVSVSKVLLQMRHRQLVPSLHSTQLNELIDFESSPFYVQQQLQEWCGKSLEGVQFPLRAGVSSFGAGGSNAHLILESFEPPEPAAQGAIQPWSTVFPLSARTEEQLRSMAARLRDCIRNDLQSDLACRRRLTDIAFTLQAGRRSFEHRVVVLATSKEELQQRLGEFIEDPAGRGCGPDVLVGHSKNAEAVTRFLNREERDDLITMLSQRRDARKLAQLWVDGLLPDWLRLRNQLSGRRTPLPTYPFADKRHWALTPTAAPRRSGQAAALHPLIDLNESQFGVLRFRKTFHADEFFLCDHHVGDLPTLPGVAYLELARKAGELAAGRAVHKIHNILWVSPINLQDEKTKTVIVELKPKGHTAHFEVFSEGPDGARTLHSQGKLTYAGAQPPAAQYVDLQAIRARATRVVEGSDVYPLFESAGLNLGPTFRVLKQVYTNEQEALGALHLPEARRDDLEDWILHPALVDGSLQAAMAVKVGDPAAELLVPFTIGEVEILHPLLSECFSYVTASGNDAQERSKVVKSNVLIVDSTGRILVRMRDSVGVPLREVQQKQQPVAESDTFEDLYYGYDWERSPEVSAALALPEDIVLFHSDPELRECFEARLRAEPRGLERLICVEPAGEYEVVGPRSYRIDPRKAADFVRLLTDMVDRGHSVSALCFAWNQPRVQVADGSVSDDWSLLEGGIFPLLLLCQALIAKKWDAGVRLLVLHSGETAQQEALDGFIKSLRIEHPKLFARVVSMTPSEGAPNQRVDALLSEWQSEQRTVTAVQYREGERYARTLRRIALATPVTSASLGSLSGARLERNGTYLITGGAGGLGLLFAEHLATEYRARLILTGRSELSAARQTRIEGLRKAGAQVLYHPADVSRPEDVRNLIEAGKRRFGRINGIIHAAGVLRDSYIRNKTRADLEAVFAPKILGTLNLDAATKDEDLDFFALFSSLAAVAGNVGQSDYAYANHFMDAFAARREELRARGQRRGAAVSFNWSLWADGGMSVDEPTRALFRKTLGIRPIERAGGLQSFVRGLACGRSQIAVLEGIQDKIETAWGLRVRTASPPREAARGQPAMFARAPANTAAGAAESGSDVGGQDELLTLVRQELSDIAIRFLQLDAADLDPDRILLELGFDSIGLTTYANSINERYGLDITPVLFFDHASISALSAHLVQQKGQELARFHSTRGAGSPRTTALPLPMQPAGNADEPLPLPFTERLSDAADPQRSNATTAFTTITSSNRFIAQPIAIVGMAGAMPASDDLEAFWDNLSNARDLISEVPRDRWNWEEYYGDPLKELNKSNSKWGGFMRNVDKFDPLFFGISPREAQMMDPQQRIFLQTVWQAIEDSGQKVSDLSGTRTGLFVGVATNDYIDLLNVRKIPLDGYSASGNSHSVLANRVSFLLNLRGPSAPLDTACSSSLVAIHRAVESIHTGSCDMAIAGGVQVMLTPAGHISFGAAGMLSSDGRCKAFDKRANGYVRGEGVGAIFLKPLSKAVEDGNHIYAVIKATTENHGGKVTTLTAPNPAAQAELLIEAYDKAEVDPTHVGYIECHGTGTSLGDPIEIQALSRSFAQLYRRHNKAVPDTPCCGLSAVKTNIGHLETAAGIAGILKALLAIKHRQIPATLHFEELNPYISLKGTPFHIVDKTTAWQAPRGPDGSTRPRLAGISSFGFGGANTHIVLEEYLPPSRPTESANRPQVIVLSAKNAERLQAYALSIAAYVQTHEVELRDVAYTLQVGRDEMSERLAFVVSDAKELAEVLGQFAADPEHFTAGYRGTVRGKRGVSRVTSTAAVNTELSMLAQQWVQGAAIDWSAPHEGDAPRRISLPTYPFAKESHWISELASAPPEPVAHSEVLHPMVHRNTSSLREQKFASRFTGREFYLADHSVSGQCVLPGVGYMEMARAAAALSADAEVRYLRDVTWLTPLVVGAQAKEVELALRPLAEEVEFTIRTSDGQSSVTHCRGKAGYASHVPPPAPLDIDAIQARCEQRMEGGELYEFLCTSELMFGSGMRVVQRVCSSHSECLVELQLPEHLRVQAALYELHPALMDGSLHTAIGLVKRMRSDIPWALPYSVADVQLFGSLKALKYGYATWDVSALQDDQGFIRMSFHLLTADGDVLLRMTDFVARPFRESAARSLLIEGIDVHASSRSPSMLSATADVEPASEVLHELTPVWNVLHWNPASPAATRPGAAVLCLGGSKAAQRWVQRTCSDAQFVELPPAAGVEAIEREINTRSFSQLLWIAPDVQTEESAAVDDADVIAEQDGGVIAVFRIIKALLAQGYGTRSLDWTVITGNTLAVNPTDPVRATHAAVSGLIGSVAKEYPHWNLRLLDVDNLDAVQAGSCLQLPREGLGNGLALRKGEWFQQTLATVEELPQGPCAYKQNGVYVVIGGAGGLGELWSRFMIEHYQARMVWIGRQPKSAALQARIDALGSLGVPPLYITADATRLCDLQEAARQIRLAYPVERGPTDRGLTVHGVVHSAIVLRDQGIAQMDEAAFRAALDAKVAVAVNLDRVFADANPDFVLFFSSIMSFTKAPGQANYAAGCTFEDSFACELQQRRRYAVKVMNWGYWGDLGVVAGETYRRSMQRLGVGSLRAAEGMESLRKLVSSNLTQIALLRTLNEQARAALSLQESVIYLPEQCLEPAVAAPSLGVDLSTAATEQNSPRALEQVTQLAAQLPSAEANTLVLEMVAAVLAAEGLLADSTVQTRDRNAKTPNGQGRTLSGSRRSWLQTTLRHLREQHLTDECDRLARPVRALDTLWSEWQQLKMRQAAARPWQQAQALFLETCLQALPAVLRGERSATEVLFPDSSMQLLEGIYRDNPVADHFNQVLAQTVAATLGDWRTGRGRSRFRLLEIGAGTGGTTATVLPALAPLWEAVEEYCYTDVSKAFLSYGTEHFRAHCNTLTTHLFDVTQPLAGQSVLAGQYDVAIAANVLHATADIRQTLRNAKAVLRSGGVLLLNEISTWSLFSHLTFGLLDGWWLHQDPAVRIAGSPGLTAESWSTVLASEGFHSVRFPARAAHGLGQQIIVAVSDGVIRQRKAPAERASKSASDTQRTSAARTRIDSAPIKPMPTFASPGVSEPMSTQVRRILVEQLCATLKLSPSLVRDDVPFADYGVDSIIGVDLVRKISEALQVEVQTTSLFEHSTLEQLTRHICSTWPDSISAQLGAAAPQSAAGRAHPMAGVAGAARVGSPAGARGNPVAGNRFSSSVSTPVSGASLAAEAAHAAAVPQADVRPGKVAIIGMSGRFAASSSLEEFWGHLSRGTELITDVERWPAASCALTGSRDRGYCSRGSFVDAIDSFDAKFFRIPHEEARYMDPQQRLFLEESWKALEDAGYAGKSVQENRCGVYVGCGSSNYDELFTDDPPAQAFWGNSESVVPARIAYHLNLRGPAIAIDTACSSSLVSIHLACQGLWSRETDMALAGGVFVQATPGFYQVTNGAGMLSVSGRCRSFDAAADGFVPGEGVGVVVLKRLEDALRDGDHIHAVIAGSGLNQDGSSNGLIAPNGTAQEQLECAVYERFGINPESIQLVEAHGTATLLGDAIECEAISRAFRKYTDRKRYCAIGSVKANIGHAATAAGVASVLKVLLALKHRQLPPYAQFSAPNPGIHLDASPFFVNTQLQSWQVPEGETRRAAVSSFGFSGTNAHLVIEEAPPIEREALQQPGFLVVSSARTAQQLREQVTNLLACVKDSPTLSLGDLSYTLVVGRSPFKHRVACVARTVDELTGLLEQWIAHGEAPHLYSGEVLEGNGERPTLKKFANYCMEACVNAESAVSYFENLEALADLYVQGAAPELHPLFRHGGRKISLPTYPFARERFWVKSPAIQANGAAPSVRSVAIHPLLHTNVSDLLQQRYVSHFSGDEPFLYERRPRATSNHSQKQLPPILLLEMARAAVENASRTGSESSVLELRELTWGEPIVVSHSVDVEIALARAADGFIDWEIASGEGTGEAVHCRGKAFVTPSLPIPQINLERLRAQMTRGRVDSASPPGLGAVGRRSTMDNAVKSLYLGTRQLLAEIPASDRWPRGSGIESPSYCLSPAVLEGLLQATLQLITEPGNPFEETPLPQTLQLLRIAAACTDSVFAWVRFCTESDPAAADGALDADLIDSHGVVCAQLRGLTWVAPANARSEVNWDFRRGPVPTVEPGAAIVSSLTDPQKMQLFLKEEVAAQLRQPAASIEIDQTYFDLGVSSLGITNLVRKTNLLLEENISARVIFDHRDIRSFAAYLVTTYPAKVAAVTVIRDSHKEAESAAGQSESARRGGSWRRLKKEDPRAEAGESAERAWPDEPDAGSYEKLTF